MVSGGAFQKECAVRFCTFAYTCYDAPMSIENTRHTLAHLLAASVLKHYPKAKPTIGPAVDNGFYYDFEFPKGKAPSEQDLAKIEKTMRELLPSWIAFTHEKASPAKARAKMKGNDYKLELIKEIVKAKQDITFYTCGKFTDLCRGGHAKNPAKEIPADSFRLDRVAGAYWRGDEKNNMLTRIYGLAFASKQELDAYLAQREEAKKRDHRILGKELDLFTFSELVGSGLPLWTPRGTILRRELDRFVQELRAEYGYEGVTIPHITKRNLYETSGHWEKFANELFCIKTREGKEYAMKPMNCPHHTQIYARKPHSYRELPKRFSETTMVYRDEQSGELGGLTRVLSITQDDSHIFCRHSHVEQEYLGIWTIIERFYGTFGFKLRVRLSFHDSKHPENYLGTPAIWKKAESALKRIAEIKKADFFIAEGEAAMYGPKLDFMALDAIGREHQVATIQLDMNLPERFDLSCINEKNEKERIVMIHCAIMGSIERFSAVLIEHTAGVFPLWLSPVQVKILPVSEKHGEYASDILKQLKAANIRAEISEATESLGKRIRETKLEKVPYFLVLGDAEVGAHTATLEGHAGKVGALPIAEIVHTLQNEIKTRS